MRNSVDRDKIVIKGWDIQELTEFMKKLKEKPYRAKQLHIWLYRKLARSFEEMTDLPAILRNYLEKKTIINLVEPVEVIKSPDDNSEKYLFRLTDGNYIESVYMESQGRRTVCLSTQVGCNLGCTFCATARMGLKRNLTAGEILDQFLFINRTKDRKITNIVYMGMGEPLLNYEDTIKSIKILNSELGPEISARKITVSTCGIVPIIYRIANERHKFKLAISLNATTNEQRNKIMPINKKYPIKDILKAINYYTSNLKRRVTFEYVIIKGFNDSVNDAKRLKSLLSGIPCKLNIIPFNENEFSKFQSSDEKTMDKFIEEIYKAPFAVTVRRSQGRSIKGACGQLYCKQN
ncbi:MAG: 23S rRNA (adenine(2503)-C(2))-methyltransferase RlmN [Candidatus Marinimicrobia bacterium]|nr:23S rRNA (adenine(2503)-C(2))-methyltransferase RlmN [Candidatus Neomarinimicrobiota bacterium]